MWEFLSKIVTLMGMLWASAYWVRWYADDEPADPAPKRVKFMSQMMLIYVYRSKRSNLDGLTNDGNLLDSILMDNVIKDYLGLRRVCRGTKA